MMLAVVMLGMSSCDKESEGLTSITYFPVITLEGDSYMIVDKGSVFVDPGCKAELNGEDVTSQVKVISSVDTSKSGVYSVNYVVYNEDGFAATASRTVVVLNPADAIEGFYTTDPGSYRLREGAKVVYGASFEILVLGNGDGTYDVEDLLGGYYSQRAGYGSAYNCEGIITIDGDGNVSAVDSYVAGWGDSLDEDLIDGKYDAATGTFSWNAPYAGMNFFVTMTKE